jgi:membrane protein implicated in regulation of membrane protease activity
MRDVSMKSRVATAALFFMGFSLLWIPVANAYIDPGTGSFVFQAAIGALLAAGVAIKLFWKRFVRFATRKDRATPDV